MNANMEELEEEKDQLKQDLATYKKRAEDAERLA